MNGGIKKWFMLQMWRIQQVAQVLTLVLMAINLALQLYGYMSWREDSIWATPYTGASLILFGIVLIIWVFAMIWDTKLKMWREQQAVLVERNPYAKEKMTSKELALYGYFWLPMMEKLAKDDPEVKKAVVLMREWLKRAYAEDKSLAVEVEHIFDYVGKDKAALNELKSK